MNSVCDANRSGPQTRHVAQWNGVRAVCEVIVAGICTLAFLLTAAGICSSLKAAGSHDFIEYWASAHQLIHHANPYDRDAILRLELSAGFPIDTPALVMGNAPPAILLVLPLGYFGPLIGEMLWSLFSLSCLVASVRIIWIMHGRPANQMNLLGYSFGPALVCLIAGQMSLQLLLGLVLFLRLHRSRPFLAGASLWLCMLKPQLFLPFSIALLLWAIFTRSYSVLMGLAGAIGISSASILFFDPTVWAHYGQMMSAVRYDRMAVPCLSNLLRRSINPGTMWLQYLPAALACVWAISYFRKNRNHWDWLDHGSMLMLVSVLVAPYAWITDQAILIPALLQGLYLTSSRNLVALLALASAFIQVSLFQGGTQLLHSSWYLWTAPAWLVWYLCATHSTKSKAVRDPSQFMTDPLRAGETP
jgi:hypothetical protein